MRCVIVRQHEFQSTPSRRGRPKPRKQGGFTLTVSIHSLTQRETPLACGVCGAVQRFNPLPHAEGDGSHSTMFFCPFQFQSTPSRRGRHWNIKNASQRTCFNPLPHAEGDSAYYRPKPPSSTFQSTPSRRGRLFSFFCLHR